MFRNTLPIVSSPQLLNPTCSTKLHGGIRLQGLQWYLVTMARLGAVICCALCCYFLLVCIVRAQSSADSLFESPKGAFQYDSTLEAAEAQNAIDSFLEKESLRKVSTEMPTTTKLSRLLSAKQKRPSDRHRYSVMEHDNLNMDMANSYADCAYHLAFTLIEPAAQANQIASKLMTKFRNTLSSILVNLNSTNLDSGALCIHLITDGSVRARINDVIVRVHEELVRKSTHQPSHNHIYEHGKHSGKDVEEDDELAFAHRPLTKYFFIDSGAIESQLEPLLPTLKTYFTHKPNSYYANALFFYSMVLHRVIPKHVADRIILLDVDVQLDANILELFEEFGRFKPEQVIGIAREQQPVYRHILHEYRRANENTTAGSPPPTGFPGYNSGVLLLHLRKMRQSFLYNSLINDVLITHLCRKYRFRGHLGDQDFYTVAALDYPQLFHTLPCGWNRQLCQWWRFHGYGAVFDGYHACEDTIKLYHGNCNSALPSLTSYGEYRRKR